MTKIYKRFRKLSRKFDPTTKGGGNENDAAQIRHRHTDL
jgi:hypothetical protein